jgi:hypothetical protein
MKSSKQRKVTRRSFLETALKGGALAGAASLTITKDLFAQASGPLVIGHHCDLTGVISSWGVWHDKAAKAAVDVINKGGGIAGRKVDLVTEDTESDPASGARKLRNLIQRSNAEFIVGSVHSGVMLAALPIASEAKTIYFSTGEATEVTGSKGTRFSFRTGTDTYSIAAASMPWCVENFGKVWTIIYADYAWGQSTNQESKLFIEKAGGKVLVRVQQLQDLQAREVEEITRDAATYRARYLPDLVSYALAVEDSETVGRFLDTDYFDTGRPAHALVATRAIVAEVGDKPDEALELYEDAAARWSEYGFVLGQANALFGAGRALLALGRPNEATARLQEARTLYQDLGAAPSVGRVDDALARATSVSA